MTIRFRIRSISSATLLAALLAALSWTPVARAETAYLVRDIEPGNQSWVPDPTITPFPLFGGLPSQIVALGDLVVFAANQRESGFEPWVSDGTEAGTRQLADLNPGAGGSPPLIFGVAGDQVLFLAEVGAGRQRLFLTDGTPNGTQPLDIPCDPDCGSVSRISGQLAGYLFFELYDGQRREVVLYRSNGTAAGTVAVAGFCTPQPISDFCFDRVSAMVSDHDKLVVVLSVGTHFQYALRFDAPLAAPQPLHAGCSVISSPTLTRDTMLFFGRCGTDVGLDNLYAADDGVSEPRWLGNLGQAYQLVGGAGSGALFNLSNGKLWRTDGSVSGTEMVEGLSHVWRMAAFGSGFIMTANRTADGVRGLFAVDERGESQVLLVEGEPGGVVVSSGGRVFFDANVGGLGLEPWATEGTAETTRRLGDIAPGPRPSYPGAEASSSFTGESPSGFTVAGDRVFFDADDGTHGSELWAALLDPESEPPSCVGETGVLCLQGRFRAAVTWSAPVAGTGTGQPVALTADTGAFWFFGAQNLELIVKVVDGRVLNGHHWVFYGGLTNVSFTLVVTDVVTGRTWTYVNTSGAFASGADTQAFPSDD